jgi:hypothetical protein
MKMACQSKTASKVTEKFSIFLAAWKLVVEVFFGIKCASVGAFVDPARNPIVSTSAFRTIRRVWAL